MARKKSPNIKFRNYMGGINKRIMEVNFQSTLAGFQNRPLGYVWLGLQGIDDGGARYAFNLRYDQAVKLAYHIFDNVPEHFIRMEKLRREKRK